MHVCCGWFYGLWRSLKESGSAAAAGPTAAIGIPAAAVAADLAVRVLRLQQQAFSSSGGGTALGTAAATAGRSGGSRAGFQHSLMHSGCRELHPAGWVIPIPGVGGVGV